MRLVAAALLTLIAAPILATPVLARPTPPSIPILVPLTGFLSLEGASQRNGALLALRMAGVPSYHRVIDTGTSPELAVNALQKSLRDKHVTAIVASMLGTQMLAMLPIAAERKVPLITVSGTAEITERGNPYVFRFFPSDAVVKQAQARYVATTLEARKPALLYQTTAYGQSGSAHLRKYLADLGAPLVFEEGLSTTVKDMLPVLAKLRASGADAIVLHLHAPATALVIRQARSMGMDLPIIAGSAMHQPATAALLEPDELKGVCAESSASPISGGSPEMERFAAAYEAAFHSPPDAFAAGQYDGVMMLLGALANTPSTSEKARAALATGTYKGVAMTYKSDGAGNMAHDAVILCYDGASRLPKVVKRYHNLSGVPGLP